MLKEFDKQKINSNLFLFINAFKKVGFFVVVSNIISKLVNLINLILIIFHFFFFFVYL